MMMRRHLSRPISLTAALLLVFLVAACQQTPRPTPIPASAVPTVVRATAIPTALPQPVVDNSDSLGHSSLRVLNTLHTPFDVYLDGALIGSELGFGAPTGSVGYASKAYTLRVATYGADIRSATPLVSQKINLDLGVSLIAVIYGKPDKPSVAVLAIDTSTLAAKKVRVAVADFLPNTDSVDVTIDAKPAVTLNRVGTLSDTVVLPFATKTIGFVQGSTTVATYPAAFKDRQSYLLLLIDKDNVITIGEPTPSESRLRAVAAIPELGAIDIFLNDQPLAQNLAYGKAGDWQRVPTRTSTISVVKAGGERAKPLFTISIDLVADGVTDLFVMGTAQALQINPIDEDLSPTAPNAGRLMVVNAAPGVDGLRTIDRGVALTGLDSIDYGHSSAAVSVGAQPLTLAFQVLEEATPRAIELKPAFEIKAGTAYIYVVTGSTSDKPAVILTSDVGVSTEPTPTPTGGPVLQVRLVNALSGDTNISLSLDGTPLITGIGPGTGSAYMPLPVAVGKLTLIDATSAGTLLSTDLTPVTDGRLTIFAIGSAKSVQLIQLLDTLAPDPATAIIRVIHAASNTGTVRVDLPSLTPSSVSVDQPTATPNHPVAPPELVSQLSFGQVSAWRTLPPDLYNLAIHAGSNNVVLGKLENVTIEANKYYDLLIVANGADNNSITPILVITDAPIDQISP